MSQTIGWRGQIVPTEENRVNPSFLFWTTLFVVVGTFVWAVAFGLAFDRVAGEGPLLTQGGTELRMFDYLLYAGYAVLVGLGIGWRGPRPVGLHGLIVAALYIVIFFGRRALVAPQIAIPFVLLVTACAMAFGAFRDARAPRTGE